MFAGESDAISFNLMIKRYGVIFKGKWSITQKAYVMLGVDAVGRALSKQISGSTSTEAFRLTYGVKENTPFRFIMGGCGPRNGIGGCGSPARGAYTWGSREVEYAENSPFSSPGPYRSARTASIISIHSIVHELGHAFAARFNDDFPFNPYKMVESSSNLGNPFGYAPEGKGEQGMWRPNTSTSREETFANMYLGWIYGMWGTGRIGLDRAAFMFINMEKWISFLVGR
jgi:hypothetical protein